MASPLRFPQVGFPAASKVFVALLSKSAQNRFVNVPFVHFFLLDKISFLSLASLFSSPFSHLIFSKLFIIKGVYVEVRTYAMRYGLWV